MHSFHSVIVLYFMLYFGIAAVCGLVPRPANVDKSSIYFVMRNEIDFIHAYPRCFLLIESRRRFFQRLQFVKLTNFVNESKNQPLKEIHITIDHGCDELSHKLWPSQRMIENYSIDIRNQSVKVVAPEIWGALYAMETILQSVVRNADNQICVPGCTIEDSPRYSHRGFLIDTSRHFLPVSNILQFLDAMQMVKMNVLHWHIVDDQSFPYWSYTYPELAEKGAYDGKLMVYTPTDVNNILEYARQRGIRVMPEIDTPGHVESWSKSHPEIFTECYSEGKPNGKLGPLNVADTTTYNFLMVFFEEILSVFPDSFIHLGGDEVPYDCWASNPQVQAFMKQMEFGQNYSRLQAYFTKNLIDLLNLSKSPDRSFTPVVWQEVYDNNYKAQKDTIIHVWKSSWESEVKQITKDGFRVLLSSCWYLNYISYASDWKSAYLCDPGNFGGVPEEIALVIGGEAAMWGEYVDSTNIFSRSWPRGAAAAERLWSTGKFETGEFAGRLDKLRCQMLSLGMNAEPVNGAGYCRMFY